MSAEPNTESPQSIVPAWRAWNRAAVALVILAGVGIRAWRLDSPPLWVDEAESSINALTILEHGVPADHYLDQPIYENTLIKPWPESEEYEFKDISYSDKGLAVYHGWLPLYSIAASLKLFGIEPDKAKDPPRAQHDREEFRKRTIVPRLPSLLYSALFLALIYRLGCALGGREVGWALLLAGAFAKKMIWLGRNARYYSPTLAFSVACGLAIWNVSRRGLWRDYILTGISFALLFHCHILSFTILGAVFAAMLPLILRQQGALLKLAATGAIIVSAALPWMIYSGFLGHSGGIPSALSTLDLSRDVLIYPLTKLAFVVPCVLGLLWLAALWPMRKRIPERWARPFLDELPAFYFATVWTVISFAAFNVMIPAASYFVQRITLVVAVPGLVLTALVFAAAARAFQPARAHWLAPAALMLLLGVTGRLNWSVPGDEATGLRHLHVAAWMRNWELPSGARVYASPNEHLVLTYYSGMPVQNGAAIRKSWLDAPEREFVMIEAIPHFNPLSDEAIQELGEANGQHFGRGRGPIIAMRKKLRYLPLVLHLNGRVAEVIPAPPEAVTPFEQLLIEQAKKETIEDIQEEMSWIPMLRGREFTMWSESWWYFFTRFVDPESRRGDKRNFWDRARHSRAHVLPFGWVAYDCTSGKIVPPFADSSDGDDD